jgi:thioesterase domain-containing protein
VNDVPGTPAVPPSGVVALRATGTRPPLFCVGPMTGVVFVYADLARHLGDDQPVFGLHPPGIDGRARPARTVEAQAAAMAAALALAHPTGPVNLLGWSYGGLVAFELAQQLVREGREVGQLALLDAPAPAAPRLDRAVASVATVLAAAWPYLRAYGRLRRLAARAIARATAADHPTVQLDAPALRPMLDLFMASAGAARRYRARPYPGALTLLRTGDPAAWGHDRTLGWLTLASAGVEVVPIPGGHMTLLRRPHVDTLAAELRARL